MEERVSRVRVIVSFAWWKLGDLSTKVRSVSILAGGLGLHGGLGKLPVKDD